MKILLATPRGFCTGVKRAIDIVEESLKKFSDKLPIYILKEIVHNRRIVEYFQKKGALSIPSINNAPEGSVLIFSAHGVPPHFYVEATNRKIHIIDATCPLVKKVHLEAIEYSKKGYEILYLGYEGHDEAIGVLAEAPKSIILVKNKEEAQIVQPRQTEKLAYLTQTTLSMLETTEIIEILKSRFPKIESPDKQDICYATTDRQIAITKLAKKCNAVLVLGSENSSNAMRLKECAEKAGAKAYLLDDVGSICKSWFKEDDTICITAGASTPEELVIEAVEYIRSI